MELSYWSILLGIIMFCCKSDKAEIENLPEYPEIAVQQLLNLDPMVEESSGIIKVNGALWTHNDSGGEAAIYRLNSESGMVDHTLYLDNAKNVDWEDLTVDSSFVYVSNFGNNLGSRKDLMIYRIPLSSIENVEGKSSHLFAEEIRFRYPDQKDFPNNYNHTFDAEAFLSVGDSIYIFTKNWSDNKCKLYKISNSPGDYDAAFVSSFDTKGLITSAAQHPSKKEVVLAGYNYGQGFDPFIWVLSSYEGNQFFEGEKIRYNLSLTNKQIEAICFEKEQQYLLTSEAGNEKAQLYQLTLQ